MLVANHAPHVLGGGVRNASFWTAERHCRRVNGRAAVPPVRQLPVDLDWIEGSPRPSQTWRFVPSSMGGQRNRRACRMGSPTSKCGEHLHDMLEEREK